MWLQKIVIKLGFHQFAVPEKKTEAAFIEPMLLLRKEKLPEGPGWLVELKFDGYRALAVKHGGKVRLRSRNDKDFNGRYPAIVKALSAMPDGTVIDGEIVALDQNGKPSFSLLQNYGSAVGSLYYFIFDVLILKGRDVMAQTLVRRRALLEKHIFPKMSDKSRILSGYQSCSTSTSNHRITRHWQGTFRNRLML